MKRKFFLAAVAAGLGGWTASADALPTYSLGLPVPTVFFTNVTNEADASAWQMTNRFFAASAGYLVGHDTSSTNWPVSPPRPDTVASAMRYSLGQAEYGFAWERLKPEYFLGDRLRPPAGVDWEETWKLYKDLYDKWVGEVSNTVTHVVSTNYPTSYGTIFDYDPDKPGVYVTKGGVEVFHWVVRDANGGLATNEIPYIAGSVATGRPRRIFWTDYPYNGQKINLQGKFVEFFGLEKLVIPEIRTVTNMVGGVAMEQKNQVTQGLYLDPSSMMLEARGKLNGQVVMVYYEDGNKEKILYVQTVEICSPEVIDRDVAVGDVVLPDGRGYTIDGLVPRITAGVGVTSDSRGDYLYQHTGLHSYSPKNGAVFAIRPNGNERWKAEIYWMETDPMDVSWPFELDQYRIGWPDEIQCFVRGDLNGDSGAPIRLPKPYTGELMKYQEPDGHAMDVGVDGTFSTDFGKFPDADVGYSILKLTGDDNIWFLPIKSIPRSNTNYYTLASSRVTIGQELELRGGTRAGTAPDVYFLATDEEPGYIYQAGTPKHNYDPWTYSETNATSSVYAINTEGAIEVWWKERCQVKDMPVPIPVPVLPQVYKPVWPTVEEAPQIVIASEEGSANETRYGHFGAAYFDTTNATMTLPDRNYFPSGAGTVMFWTRSAHYATDPAPTATNAPGRILTLLGGKILAEIERDHLGRPLICTRVGGMYAETALPANDVPNAWHHVAISFGPSNLSIYLDGARTDSDGTGGGDLPTLSGAANTFGAKGGALAAPGREVAEILFFSENLESNQVVRERFALHTGQEGNVTGYWSFRAGEDLSAVIQATDYDIRWFRDRIAEDGLCEAENVAYVAPGAPLRSGCVISCDADTTPTVYRQPDRNSPDCYRPNLEHAFVREGEGGYVVWALRSDLRANPAVFCHYTLDGRRRQQFLHVLTTNEDNPELAGPCTAGQALPGPHPIDYFDNPWLAQDKWRNVLDDKADAVYRDRKGQLWSIAGDRVFDIWLYYRQQEEFDYPEGVGRPAVGDPVPWLAALGKDPRVCISNDPHPWRWTSSWPKNPKVMKIGQTLTVADQDLPEVWNAKSVAVLYPNSADVETVNKTVMLSDPTVARTVAFPEDDFARTGLSTDPNGGLTQRSGKYYFTGLPPFISNRFYYDKSTQRLCLTGERVVKNAGATILYPNVLLKSERTAIIKLVDRIQLGYTAWERAINGLAVDPVIPNSMEIGPRSREADAPDELTVAYGAVDHYALTAMGATNWVVLIENDAQEKWMKDGLACPVADGDPINVRVLCVTNLYYTGRIVTREDEVNLLSEKLSVLYTDPFGGKADDFEFEWKSAPPKSDGTIPADYANGYVARPVATNADELAGSSSTAGQGLTRFTVGQQGDTLANMVNKYWICRYRAVKGTTAYKTMGDQWSAWCAPPALAEGWVQRVLNNVTPFNQRMTDLYANKAETAVSMIQQAGGPFTGDVALNQDNLTSVGLIQLYETILDKAESMSLLLGINDPGANKQLQLAVERLGDLYKVLGDEAYSDAKNPTIGFGTTVERPEGVQWEIDFGSVSSSLFCFDNQVNSLLDEELCLLRGRSGASAPTTHMGPYFNRLVWNFTKGITAGEVAYAVNYNVNGSETVALSEEQAARTYPQGHGDAYGHYLSALKGWYRLLRNPNFTWGLPAQGEMNVADSAVNVDYYEEAKFATAAADLAKTAADVVDLSARKAWRDNGKDSSGYLDTEADNAFGFGEWASRGAYGALVNWAAANSILPQDINLETARDESGNPDAAQYKDKGLTRIDRGSVDELADICQSAADIVAALDRVDAGLNPLGLSDQAIPFDISPEGASDGTHTHYEQVRDRAKAALANARKVLDRAQTQANRMRMVESAAEGYAASIAAEEEDFNNELIGYYGTPYSDDIGPGKTYVQGYDGPDLYHFMWMDLNQYGLDSVGNQTVVSRTFSGADLAKRTSYDMIRQTINAAEASHKYELTYEVSRSGFVRKPDSIKGYRVAPGTIQQKYADMLLAYYALTSAQAGYNKAKEQYYVVRDYTSACIGLGTAFTAAEEALNVARLVNNVQQAATSMALNTIKGAEDMKDATLGATIKAVPSVIGAGLTVVTSPRSVAEAVAAMTDTASLTAKVVLKNTSIALDTALKEAEVGVDTAYEIYSWYKDYFSMTEQFKSAALDVNSAYRGLIDAMQKLEVAVDAVNTEIGNAEAVLAKRENARKRQVDKLSQLRYNEMLFRKIRDKSLSRYTAAFDVAQKYVFMAAQAYDYETALRRENDGSGDAFKAKIVATRSLGAFDADGEPLVADDGDLGLAGYLAQMDANWQVLKPRLGINNPQPYTTWFSLREELFRIYGTEAGNANWAEELKKHWVDDIQSHPAYRRHCQKFQSQFGVKEKEPGLVIPFSTTIDYAKNLFGQDLAGNDHAYDSSWYSTRIAAAGVWFDGYNEKSADAVRSAQPQLAATPVVYLIPAGHDCMRAPGLSDGTYWQFSVIDQVIPAPYNIGSYDLDQDTWYPSMNDADWGDGYDPTVKIRKHPSFRAYYGPEGAQPTDDRLDATRLIGRSVWNDQWYLVIPAGSMNADRDKALSVFINGLDTNGDGKLDLKPVSDIKIGFRTYSQSGN